MTTYIHIAVLIIMCIGKSRGGNYIVTQLAVLFFFFGREKKEKKFSRTYPGISM